MGELAGGTMTACCRQQAASAVELECDKLNSSLYAVTFLAHQSGHKSLSLVSGHGP